MDEIRSNRNVVYRCTYHVVWCPKYRRPVIGGRVDARLKQIIREVCAERDAPIVELETMPDHVHLLVSCDPQYGIHRLVKQIKGRSSRLLRQEFPTLKTRIPRCGPTATSSPPSAAQPWRSSNAMWRTNGTLRALPYLPMAKARGFSGAF